MEDRVPLIAGNWKMNLNILESASLVKSIRDNITDLEEIYITISQTVRDVILSDLVIADFLPSHFIVTDYGGGDYQVLPNGTQKIEFTRSILAMNESWNVNFQITTFELGEFILTNFANSNLSFNLISDSYTFFRAIFFPFNSSRMFLKILGDMAFARSANSLIASSSVGVSIIRRIPVTYEPNSESKIFFSS